MTAMKGILVHVLCACSWNLMFDLVCHCNASCVYSKCVLMSCEFSVETSARSDVVSQILNNIIESFQIAASIYGQLSTRELIWLYFHFMYTSTPLKYCYNHQIRAYVHKRAKCLPCNLAFDWSKWWCATNAWRSIITVSPSPRAWLLWNPEIPSIICIGKWSGEWSWSNRVYTLFSLTSDNGVLVFLSQHPWHMGWIDVWSHELSNGLTALIKSVTI